MERTGEIRAHKLTGTADGGHQITYEKGTSRSTFNLQSPTGGSEPRPVAAGTFALEPEHYEELMRRVAAMRGDRT